MPDRRQFLHAAGMTAAAVSLPARSYARILGANDRVRVGIVGFAEFMASTLRGIPGIESFDLEYDVQAFNARLPRVRIIPIDEFDPQLFL